MHYWGGKLFWRFQTIYPQSGWWFKFVDRIYAKSKPNIKNFFSKMISLKYKDVDFGILNICIFDNNLYYTFNFSFK